MHIVEEGQYRVACHVDRGDLKLHGITLNDLVNRTPLGRIFIKKASELAKESTAYPWTGCAQSMQMDFYRDDVVLVFSERLEDYIYNLKQSVSALSGEQAEALNQLIVRISLAGEEEARDIIRSFEQNMKDI